jgi:hypothetical protein
MSEPRRTRISLPEFCRERGISKRTAIGWIEAGELPAIDLRSATAKRPRLFLAIEDIAAFEERRHVGTQKAQVKRQKRKASDVPNF